MELQVIEEQGQRVLTTSQIAEAFGTDSKIVTKNFERNKTRYTQGKHYYCLTGEDLKTFKGSRQFDDTLKYTSILYLWTEKGAWQHAKSLNTDEAWEAYEKLVDDYYSVKQSMPKSNAELMLMYAQQFVEQEKRLLEVEERVNQQSGKVDKFATMLAEGSDRAKVNRRIEELARKKYRGDKQEASNALYATIKDKIGFDVHKRVKNKRNKLQEERKEQNQKPYADSTLKTKVTGISVLEDYNMLDDCMEILAGMLVDSIH